MKSKNLKIQILKKGIAIVMSTMFLAAPITYAATSLDDSYLESSWWEQILYGTVGSTAKEIEEYFNSGKTTLYIQNETQLRAFAEYVNNGNDCTGKEIVLYNDINLDPSNEWVPIVSFNGIFNGNNHTISGLRYLKENKKELELENVGLFKEIAEKGIVKTLILEKILINIPWQAGENTHPNLGGIVGLNNGIIESCKITSGELNGGIHIGGIAGTNNGTIKNCINYASVNGKIGVGGIVGTNEEGEIINCTNYSESKAIDGYLGGIAGENINRKHIKLFK